MSKLIAITGKGGVGKTTISALLVKNLVARGYSPVLAVDADSNSCLDAALGVSVATTVGRAREEARSEVGKNAGVSTKELLRLKIGQGLVEANGFDLIAMGRPEGEGCYCFANNVLKEVISEVSSQYPYVILDNEAGLENLSRRIVKEVDLMILVSDASNSGMQTLLRLYDLTIEMKMKYEKLALVINRLRSDKLPDRIGEITEKTKANLVIGLPDNEEVALFAEHSRNFLEIPESNPVYVKVGELISCQ
jgi:CO dehydrogenase maturation factor